MHIHIASNIHRMKNINISISLKYFYNQKHTGLVLILLLLNCLDLNAQTCLTDVFFENYNKEHPELHTEVQKLKSKHGSDKLNKKAGKVRIIPVVVHIIHDFGDENISKTRVKDAISRLNEDYRRKNADTIYTRSQYKPMAADMEIEFRLAQLDPSGKCTEGINYVQSSLTYSANNNVKSLINWDSKKYLNIWVVNKVIYPKIVIGAYGQYPGPAGGDQSTDGVVITYALFGASSYTNILTHEIGHWLGLYHVFASDCYGSGDFIDDTPPQSDFTIHVCSPAPNTCNNFTSPYTSDPPDMYENFMDYSEDACQNLFTNGQKSRVDVMLTTYRSAIYSAANLKITGVDGTGPVGCLPKVDFNFETKVVCAGNPVNLYDYCYNGGVSKRSWSFEGGTPNTSSAVNPTDIIWNSPGKYKVTLIASNPKGSDTGTKYILVLPKVDDLKPPFKSSFEDNDLSKEGWGLENIGLYTWEISNDYSRTGKKSIFIHHFSETVKPETDAFYSRGFDLSGMSKATLTFYTAHAQRGAGLNDVLRLYVSKDCGASWQLKLFKAGANLAGGVEPSYEDYFPKPEDWRRQALDLSSFLGESNIRFKFETQAIGGNNIFIDDFEISENGSLSVKTTFNEKKVMVQLYPNPINGSSKIVINSSVDAVCKFVVTDIFGKKIATRELRIAMGVNEIPFITVCNHLLIPGVYFMNVENDGTHTRLKFVQ